MTPVSTNIKIDPRLKKEAQELFESCGLTLSAAVNMFLRQAVAEQGIPFRIGRPATVAALDEVKRMKADPEMGRVYSDVDEMLEELNDD